MLGRLVQERLRDGKASVLLLGPRQVGKSTLCSALNPIRTINLAIEAEYLRYAKTPSLLLRELAAVREGGTVVLDEVQRVPALLNDVQAQLDDPANRFRFILTGSSARKLKRGQANLLPGRIVLEHLDPLTALEVGDQLDLDRALTFGMLPGIYLGGVDSVAVLQTYAEVYLREEIRAEAAAKDVGSYARFLDVMAIISGQWINYTKLSSDTEIPKETIRRFAGVLEDTLLAFRIPPFEPKAALSRRVSHRDRFILFDVGVRNALLGLLGRPLPLNQKGPLFEQWLTLQVIFLGRALRKGWAVSCYRTESGAEVDLVIERAHDIVGLEIKATPNLRAGDGRGLQSLAEVVGSYKPLTKRIVYLGERAQRFGDVEALPYRHLLEELRAE